MTNIPVRRKAPPIPKLAGVCGWPIHHSLSPLMHAWWLRQMNIPGAYVPFLVRPDDAVRAFRTLPKTTIAGLNVTLPLKRSAFEAADERTDDAERLGVANTLTTINGKLIAHNTDREGFAAPLLARLSLDALRHSTATVYGAGGAARAVIGALVDLGVPEIRLLARRDAPARDLAARTAIPSLYAVPWSERHEAARGAALLVNATSAGMKGLPPLDVDLSAATPGALAYDLIYTPRDTPFLQAARAQGLQTVDGLDMLIGQARPAFARFFGQRPPEDLDPTDLLLQHLQE